MADFKLIEENYAVDLYFNALDFEQENGLRSAVIISLFTDRRAEDDEVNGESLRGWWADTYENEKFGSKLWLLDREKQTNENLNRAQEYTDQALQWLIEENVASEIVVGTNYPETGRLNIDITIYKPDGEEINFQFDSNWQAEV
jgi:phage gp46-like protein